MDAAGTVRKVQTTATDGSFTFPPVAQGHWSLQAVLGNQAVAIPVDLDDTNAVFVSLVMGPTANPLCQLQLLPAAA